MPRLLLVDDNPSIHKIAETLLAATDIELVCLESGEEALRRVRGGERFDVALLDTAMAGLDGWGLLEQLRADPATARIPIAMMAGVLDTVDPERIQQAPIQGFLKKPVELRELGDRIHQLLAAPPPVAPPLPPSAVDTIPATAVEELIAGEADILVLGPEDLLPAEEGAEEPSLELEELDLETLHGLPDQPAAAEAPIELEEPVLADAWAEEAWDRSDVGEAPALEREEVPFLVTADELPDLGELVAASEAPTVTLDGSAAAFEVPAPEPELSLEDELDLGPPAASPAVPLAGAAAGAAAVAAGAAAAGAAAFALKEPAAPPPLPPAPSHPLVDAILQDPAALDALARALAERMSERVLQEVAWEVMPELAERLKR